MFKQSADDLPKEPISMQRRERNPYERHLMGQPYLSDFMPTQGPVPDDAVDNFMKDLAQWLEEEKRLRAIYRPYLQGDK